MCLCCPDPLKSMVFIRLPMYNLDSGEPTDEPVTFTDMFDEFSLHMKAIGCREFNSKQVERNYAFDDFPDIPAESTYLKVAYPFSSMSLLLVNT
jgi:hypothetical protein